MRRSFERRIAVLGLLVFAFLIAYMAARHFSSTLVGFVVKHALLQKAPPEISPIQVVKRYEAWVNAGSAEDKLMKMLDLSNYLEKVQRLTPAELERLLPPIGDGRSSGS